MNVTDGRKEVTWKLKMCSWICAPITLSLLRMEWKCLAQLMVLCSLLDTASDFSFHVFSSTVFMILLLYGPTLSPSNPTLHFPAFLHWSYPDCAVSRTAVSIVSESYATFYVSGTTRPHRKLNYFLE